MLEAAEQGHFDGQKGLEISFIFKAA